MNSTTPFLDSDQDQGQGSHPKVGGGGIKLRWDGNINVGTILHLLGVVAVIVTLYSAIDKKVTIQQMQFDALQQQVVEIRTKVDRVDEREERIERHLLRNDRKYNQP